MKEKYHKHPTLARPKMGSYHRLEWAIYGTTCGDIEAFFNGVNKHFDEKYRLSYIDADHSRESKTTTTQVGKKKYTQSQFFEVNSFDDKFNVAFSQAVFVNGNHYSGQRQIVIINPNKRDSLWRRVGQLDNVEMVILPDEGVEMYDFLLEKMTERTKVFYRRQEEQIFDFFDREIVKTVPPLKALILAGGKSTRMKEDKSKLKYHKGLSQEEYLAGMCQGLGIQTFISKSFTEKECEINGVRVIKDRMVEMGPFGAIISALMADPESAWLVLACDLPYMSEEVVDRLVKERSILHLATAYRVKGQTFPEPLIAIYEPVIYRRMLSFLSLGYACPRKVLINSDVKHVILEDEKVAFNANTPKDKESVLSNLNTEA